MKSTIAFYNEELARYRAACTGINRVNHPDPDTFASNDETKIKWSSSLRAEFNRQKKGHFSPHQISVALYRPFTKVQAYFDPMFNHRVGQLPRIYPNSIVSNLVICVSGIGARSGFSALIADVMPDLHTIDTGQCFPLKLYEPVPASSRAATPSTLFDVDAHANTDSAATLTPDGRYTVRDGITDAGLQHFIAAYGGAKITKEALFYYIYGLLHSPEYKARYADNLSKELPRIPCVRTYKDFQAFSTAGRQLAALHLGYETVTPYAVTFEGAAANKAELQKFDLADYRVTQMKFATKADKTRVVYNHKITIANIPLEAYDYIVNGKPALEWVMERQAITTHKDSGIINDANCWAIETMQDAAYPLKLFQRVITVSLETMKIVHALPKLELLE